MSCKHRWTLHPPNQNHQYKCLNCSAIGHINSRTQKVEAYRCMKPGCNADAVETVDGVRLCLRHK